MWSMNRISSVSNNDYLYYKGWYKRIFSLLLNVDMVSVININNNVELCEIRLEKLYYIKHYLLKYMGNKGIIICINDYNVLYYSLSELREYLDNVWNYPLKIKICNYHNYKFIKNKLDRIENDRKMRNNIYYWSLMNTEFCDISNRVSIIKAFWKMYRQRLSYKYIIRKIILIQSVVRGKLCRVYLNNRKNSILKIEDFISHYLNSKKYTKEVNAVCMKYMIRSMVMVCIDKSVSNVVNKHKLSKESVKINMKISGLDREYRLICNSSQRKLQEDYKLMTVMEAKNAEVIFDNIRREYEERNRINLDNNLNMHYNDILKNGILVLKHTIVGKTNVCKLWYDNIKKCIYCKNINSLFKSTIVINICDIVDIYNYSKLLIKKVNDNIFTIAVNKNQSHRLYYFETCNYIKKNNIVNILIKYKNCI
jgi:hypothetical protein